VNIITLKRPVPTNVVFPTFIGVTMPSSGSAIVSVTLDASRRPPIRTCTGIERLPYDVGKVAARVAALELGRRDVVIVDGAGAGMALWIALGSPRGLRGFKLYEGLGRERQKLVDPFPAMMLDGSFSFAPNLPHQEAMLKALANYKREVLDDGVVGNELAIALFLAIGQRPPVRPRIY
jgi:hypothetical protein